MSKRLHLAICAAATLALAACQQPSDSTSEVNESPAEQAAQDAADDAARDASSMDEAQETSPTDPDQVMDEMAGKVVGFAASMNAVGFACGMASRSETDTSKNKSREMMVARGLSAAAHDRAYDAAFEKSVAKLQSAPPAEKAKACDEVKQMMEQASKMAPAS